MSANLQTHTSVPDVIKHTDSQTVRANGEISEAFRILGTNFSFANVDGKLKYIAITSSVPGEGKSTIAANFAMALAQADKKVVLIDADLRKPILHKVFGLECYRGLTDALMESDPNAADASAFCQSIIGDSLKLLTAGTLPPNPAELLASDKMKSTLRTLGNEADFVIVDCPPVLGSNNSLALAPQVDGFLVVVGSGKAPKQGLMECKRQLDLAGAKIIGAVLNGYRRR